jgi:xanthine/uracil permease
VVVAVAVAVALVFGRFWRRLAVAAGRGAAGCLPFTAAGLFSTEQSASMTASAMPSFSTFPSHSTLTSPPPWDCTTTQPMTR